MAEADIKACIPVYCALVTGWSVQGKIIRVIVNIRFGRLSACPVNPALSDKSSRIRWTTYNRMMDKLVAADHVADKRLIRLAVRWLGH